MVSGGKWNGGLGMKNGMSPDEDPDVEVFFLSFLDRFSSIISTVRFLR